MATTFLSELNRHLTHTSFAVREGIKKREKEDNSDYFIKRIEILGGQSIIDEVKKQWRLFFFTVLVFSGCLSSQSNRPLWKPGYSSLHLTSLT